MLTWIGNDVIAQTDFGPGEIMITGYRSTDPDGFAIVLLRDVVSGTDIYATDRGWSNASGFRVDNTFEGTIRYTFTADYPCGTEFFFSRNATPNPDVWEVRNAANALIGTCVNQSPGDANGMMLGTDGDQILMYQLPEPNSSNQSSFICMIQMDNNLSGAVNNDWESELPTSLLDIHIVRFNTEVDNAKYDCTPYTGSPYNLQLAISNDNGFGFLVDDNDNNWNESNTGISITAPCNFCCSVLGAPILNGPDVVATNSTFTITFTGNLAQGEVWELRTSGCTSGSPLQTTTSNSFTITAPGTAEPLTYYIRQSGTPDCPDLCGRRPVCVVANLYANCTTCNADMNACGNCYLPDPVYNPPLGSGCYAIRLAFILDESGSIGGNAVDVKNGVLAFLNALNGQDIEAALIEFSGLARVVNTYTVINQAYIDNIEGYFNGFAYNGQTYSPSGGTNWHHAMMQVDDMDPPDLILFFTDGIPTVWNSNPPFGTDCGNPATTQPPEIVNPVKLANKVKLEGSHMFMLGVGGGIDEDNLQRMSGYIPYQSGINTLGTSDYALGDFATLAEDLENFVRELCRATIIMEKDVTGPICNGQVEFVFRIINTGTESSATNVIMTDTFPNGYANPQYFGDPLIKVCIGAACDPPQPPNTVIWVPFAIPPGDTATIMFTVDVLPSGNYVNTGYTTADNADDVSATFNGVLEENMPPTVLCPPNVTVTCPDSTLPPATGEPTATDPEGDVPTLTYSDATEPGLCPQQYTITRTWTATDGCLNTATCTQLIAVVDTNPPVITCPPDVSVECMSNTMPGTTGTATAIDGCGGVPVVTWSDMTIAGSCGMEYTILRTWTATDQCENFSTCVQTIYIVDTTPPVIECPRNALVFCGESVHPDVTGYPIVTDGCGGSVAVTWNDTYQISTDPALCYISRTWTATDDCGNSTTCLQTVIIADIVPPTIVCPADVTISCTASTLPSQTGMATATDNCDPSPAMSYSDVTMEGGCPQSYVIQRTWLAEDQCGSSNNCVQTILVTDLDAPVLTCPPNITIECTSGTLPDITGEATATDDCDDAPVITYDDVTLESMVCSQEYTITRTWSATDACGNVSTCVQTITIDDSTPPVILCPADLTLECTEVTLPDSTGFATATDNCDADPEVTYMDVILESDCPQTYTITRTWTATDTCGNESTCVQTIEVIDSTPPVIICPEDVTLECFISTLPEETGQASATDNCDDMPAVQYNDMTASVPGTLDYIISRTWTATDACGNASTCLQTITVINLLDPELIGNPYDTICSGETVTFEAEDPGIGPLLIEWSFGSGSNPPTATGAGPHVVQYTYNGTNGTTGAWVLLTLSAPGCISVTDTVANIHVNAKPNAAITVSGGTPCVFGPRTFQPTAAEMPGYTYLWNFGVGADIPSADGYGPHVIEYATPGSKTVKLVVITNEEGASCSDSTTLTFVVNTCPGNITGRVFLSNGTPIPSVNIRLFTDQNLDGQADNNTAIRSVFTNSNGVYSMAAITPGHYVIVQTQPVGYFSLYDEDASEDYDSVANVNMNDNIIPCTIEPFEIDSNNYFVEVASPGMISGYVFEDFDNNEMPGPSEGIAGVTIELHQDNDLNGMPDPGGPLETALTNSLGYYSFVDIQPGNYVLVEIQPPGYTSVKDFDASNDGDLVPNTNMMDDIIPVTLTNGEHDAHNYFIELSGCNSIITTTNDNVPGSLRFMIECVGEGDTITFHPSLAGQTLQLNAGRLEIDKDVVILCDVNPRVTIASQVNGAIKIFEGRNVEFKNLNIVSGLSGFQGAAFENHGLLTLWDVSVLRNPLLVPVEFLIFNSPSGILTAKGSLDIQTD